MSIKELKGITPTYQAVLNSQLKKVTDALDSGDVMDSFVKLKTLIGILNPKHRDPLLNNEVAHIQKELNKAVQQRGVDQYQTWLLHGSSTRSVLQRHLWDLFLKVMTQLHEGGYLELTKIIPKGRFGK